MRPFPSLLRSALLILSLSGLASAQLPDTDAVADDALDAADDAAGDVPASADVQGAIPNGEAMSALGAAMGLLGERLQGRCVEDAPTDPDDVLDQNSGHAIEACQQQVEGRVSAAAGAQAVLEACAAEAANQQDVASCRTRAVTHLTGALADTPSVPGATGMQVDGLPGIGALLADLELASGDYRKEMRLAVQEARSEFRAMVQNNHEAFLAERQAMVAEWQSAVEEARLDCKLTVPEGAEDPQNEAFADCMKTELNPDKIRLTTDMEALVRSHELTIEAAMNDVRIMHAQDLATIELRFLTEVHALLEDKGVDVPLPVRAAIEQHAQGVFTPPWERMAAAHASANDGVRVDAPKDNHLEVSL